MQIKPPFITCLALATLILGCDQKPTPSEKGEQVGAAERAAAPEQSDYTFAQRAEFKAKIQSQADAINQDIEELAARIEESSDAVKAEAAPRLKALRDQAAGLSTRMDEADNATESTWESVKTGTRQTFETLKEGFQESRQWLSEKIAP